MYCCNSKITLIVAAAGVGKRMGLGYPKQFLEVDGKPLFLKVLEVAEKTDLVENIIVVTGEDSVEYVKSECLKNQIFKISEVISGGSERQYSIEKALAHCSNDSIIAVQDGVRPFLRESYFFEALKILQDDIKVDGVVVGVPVKDTIKKIDSDGFVIETPKRSEFIAVHTPQIFRGDILKKAYSKAAEDNFLGTDDSSLVERIGGKIKVLLGSYDNIKITTIEDLKHL
ncbi:2-C-methyl-D-erythritol 4-phosphate cytidylyltransferase [Cetobacterium sp. 8H]|uniref:2-C-methyl-D-erythritol 4-phosphate cytidylyltransferase n=1 Tax=Cetobacterium sp. 8H TaxID=2759681 RepID=UPI00163C0AC4|nr:2-C-methyl-D-erythritol 4-phosphate cytidylyltransferase [Cetobacterium sp. 8H]MBC2850759.1 2-C-methyl-D-erythritol 4-phosphate cytidylyltransferase [Cetobacterium sp. 8H]